MMKRLGLSREYWEGLRLREVKFALELRVHRRCEEHNVQARVGWFGDEISERMTSSHELAKTDVAPP